MSNELLIIEKIKQLKYRYFRAVDRHDWTLLATTLTEDCVARYDNGKYGFDGRENLIAGLKPFIISSLRSMIPRIGRPWVLV